MAVVSSNTRCNWAKEVKIFDETKAGVKGLVDAGVVKIPKLFVHPPETLPGKSPATGVGLNLPTIDLQGLENGRREIVDAICVASEDWGIFQILNHGVPIEVMEAMYEGVRRFHEQPVEEKKGLYSSDSSRKVRFSSNVAKRELDPACWRDLLTCVFQDDTLDPEAIPLVFRKEVMDYVKCMIELRETLSELLSEALGLNSDYLSRMECMKSDALAFLYYPVCPEPHLTLGAARHTDTTFLTLLMPDNNIGGLQIVHQNKWVDVTPVHGALVANIGDLLQMLSNDKFKSVEHRVLAQPVGPRISVACFFTQSSRAASKPIGPIKELVSDENPPIYREFLSSEYYEAYKKKGEHVPSALPYFKMPMN